MKSQSIFLCEQAMKWNILLKQIIYDGEERISKRKKWTNRQQQHTDTLKWSTIWEQQSNAVPSHDVRAAHIVRHYKMDLGMYGIRIFTARTHIFSILREKEKIHTSRCNETGHKMTTNKVLRKMDSDHVANKKKGAPGPVMIVQCKYLLCSRPMPIYSAILSD